METGRASRGAPERAPLMMRRATLTILAGLGVGGGSALYACSVLVPLDEVQCDTPSDCLPRGPTFADSVCVNHICTAPPGDAGVSDALDAGDVAVPTGPWRCLGAPPEVLDPNAKIAVTLIVLDALQPIATAGPTGGSDLALVAGVALAGVTVRACNPLDPLCNTPATTPALTDDAGVAQLTLPGDFIGFYSLSRADVVPTDFYLGQPMSGVAAESFPAPILTKTGVQLLSQSLGVGVDLSPDASVGMVFFNAYDCDDRHASGVTFTLSNTDPQTVAWYINNGLPTTTAKETDNLGAAGAVNVPVGQLVVTATLVDGNRALGSSNVLIHPGAATIAYVRVRTH
jgi:hypothetical protein